MCRRFQVSQMVTSSQLCFHVTMNRFNVLWSMICIRPSSIRAQALLLLFIHAENRFLACGDRKIIINMDSPCLLFGCAILMQVLIHWCSLCKLSDPFYILSKLLVHHDFFIVMFGCGFIWYA